ncbi:MAG: hypothetical protein A3B04_01615 [Candidatus Portnoybacteria bacterium RIFCSPLOWO2_02_FULL_39_11]|uniref:GIY-YIG domain-containing protein n=1 Tax=Candidatus Portnoybacteria bacterium RIFCSPLOWO2_02_FULL_39_11 TaxID=1802001 RepID=A0A1G2FNA9_9BACT|nr:MAG: hypothetical protein A3B04_01615 [Candidatus Portnoybacteria bacterium RIFCSPLOWO2_02_FULL_39_11]
MPYYYVYILECSDKTLYVGCTNNLKKRIAQHNNSKQGAHYTKIRRPVILKHSEKFKKLLSARRREAEIKTWPRKRRLDLIKLGKKIQFDRVGK